MYRVTTQGYLFFPDVDFHAHAPLCCTTELAAWIWHVCKGSHHHSSYTARTTRIFMVCPMRYWKCILQSTSRLLGVPRKNETKHSCIHGPVLARQKTWIRDVYKPVIYTVLRNQFTGKMKKLKKKKTCVRSFSDSRRGDSCVKSRSH